MKIGLIVECGPQGAEVQVLPILVGKLPGNHDVDIVTMDNKPKLISECGKVASQLLANGCRRVLVLWDLYPAWRQKGEKPCRKEDRDGILASLREEKVVMAKVGLVCVEEELESWLIADGRALQAMFSSAQHPARRIPDQKRPDKVQKPKTRLTKLFQQHGKGYYNDLIHAAQIAERLPDLKRVRRSPSFARFAARLQIRGGS